MELKRYRWTPAMFDVPFLMGAVAAQALTGPSLVALLEGMGRDGSAARNLLTRMRDIGSLEIERHGRVNVYRLAPASEARYREVEGTSGSPTWTGSFGAILYNVPERQRTLRDRLIHTATSAGYGLLRPGVLIAAADRWERVRLAEADFSADAWIHRGTLTPASDDEAAALARLAWDVDGLASSYRDATSRISQVGDTTEITWATVREWRDLFASAQDAQLHDPHLPPQLLPRDWPEPPFREALDRLNARIGPPAQVLLRETAAPHDPDGRNEYYAAPWAQGSA